MCEVIEISVYESMSDFMCVVSMEVYENQCIVVFYCCVWLIFSMDNGCFYEFIIFVVSISSL